MSRKYYRKYNAKPVEIDGIKFASQKEGRRYIELKTLEEIGEIENLKCHPKYELIPTIRYPNGKLYKPVTNYIADFEYIDCSTRELITEDVKGMRTSVYQIKKALFYIRTGRFIKET